MAFFREDDIADAKNSSRLMRWANASGIRYPVTVISDSVFDRLGITKSSVIVINRTKVLYRGEIPIGRLDRERVLSYIVLLKN